MAYHHGSTILLAAILFVRMLVLHAAPVTTQPPPSSTHEVHVPQLLMDIYECWSNGGEQCLNMSANPDINVVRSLIGQYEENPLQVVQSYDQNAEPMHSVSFSFNSSAFLHDVVYTSFVRIHRKAISQTQLDLLDCDQSNLKIQLYSSQSGLDDDKEDKDIVILENSLDFFSFNLVNDEWLNFKNVTSLIQAARSRNNMMKLHLAMGGDCSGISPTKFGISLDHNPELSGYCKSETGNNVFPALMNEYKRRKRQATLDGGSGDAPKDVETRKPSTIHEINVAKCQLHDFNVSFADIGWDRYIVRPAWYNARLCGGRCDWPLDQEHNTTRHSYIQSIVNIRNPDQVPPPCCAPRPGTLGRLNVVIREADDSFVARWWDDMIAKTCACL